MKKLFFVFSLFLIVGIVNNVGAQDKPAREVTPSVALSQIKLAQELANYGYQHKDALSLLAAVGILANNQAGELKLESKTSEGSHVKKAKAETVTADILNPAKLIADAKIFAKDNPQVLAIAEKTKISKSREAVDGPVRHSDQVLAGDTDKYRIAFKGEARAEIAVIGDTDTDLDLYVYDENNILIAKDDDNTDQCYVAWVPKWTGSYKVLIINRGAVYNNYSILTN